MARQQLTQASGSGGGSGASTPDATTASKGVVQLAGDLAGTAGAPTVPGLSGKLAATSNLSDVANVSTARSSLGLGSASTQNKVAAGSAGVLDATDPTTTNSRTPTGGAGGDLTGTYPNPTLAATAVTAGSYTNTNLTVDAKGRITAASNGSGGGGSGTPNVFVPESYGAASTYNAAVDDTTAVQAAITAAVAAGGIVVLSRLYAIATGGLTVGGQVTIRGIGGQLNADPVGSLSPLALSGLVTASGTATALTVNAIGCTLQDFAVINSVSAAPTAGYGIKCTAASQTKISGVSVLAFYDDIVMQGVFWTVDHCHIYDAAHYGIKIAASSSTYNDHGDFGVVDNVIAQNYKSWAANAAVRWEAGGGARILGNKILGGAAVGNTNAGGGSGGNHFQVGVDFMAADGVDTGDAVIDGNSISNFNTAGIRLGVQNAGGTAGDFIYCTITNNNINVGWGTTACAAIIGAPTTALQQKIKNVVFTGNNINNVPFGLDAYCLQGLEVGRNMWDNMTGTSPWLIRLANTPDDGVSTRSVTVAAQGLGNLTGIDLIQDLRRPWSGNSLDGHCDYSFTANYYANATGWQTVGYVDLDSSGEGKAVDLEVLFTGSDYGVGAVYARYRRILTVKSVGPVTVATDGSDTTAGLGTHYGVQFVTTTNNRVIVQVQMTSGGVTLWGRCRITPRGDVLRIHKGS